MRVELSEAKLGVGTLSIMGLWAIGLLSAKRIPVAEALSAVKLRVLLPVQLPVQLPV